METLIIDNWAGALTRQNFGKINSGLANFDTSFGYNPFFNPGQLTWFKSPSNVTSIITDSSLILDGQTRLEGSDLFTYAISDSGKVWKIGFDGGSAILLKTLSVGSPTFVYGGTLVFFNGVMMIGHDKGITRLNFDGSAETVVGTWDATNYIQNTYRPLQAFKDLLIYGNATTGTDTNVGSVNSAYVVNPSVFATALPVGTYVRDLDVTPDFTYLLVSLSYIAPEAISPVNDRGNTAASDSFLFQWNGADDSPTVGTSLPGFGITSTQSFSGRQMMFMYDTFGAALYEGGLKKWTLRNQKSPFPNATTSAGNFVVWAAPDFYYNLDTQASGIYGSLYYYGQLDEDSPVGLWRVLRQSSAIGGVIYTMPFNQFTTNRYVSVNTAAVVQVDSNGAHLLSWIDYSGSGGSTNKRLYYFAVSPPDDSPGGWTGAIAGVYQTQTQMFSKKASVTQIRVYTNPTVSNNQFQLDLIGPDGKIISNGTFNYTFAAGTDITLRQGALDRINFQAATAPFYGLGVRITNIGTQNMVVNKVEIDTQPSGK